MHISAHGGVGYGYEWVRVQDFVFMWTANGWAYQTTDLPAFSKVGVGGRLSNWMLSNGTSVELNPSWNVIGGYWLATQLVTWYDSSGHQVDHYYYAIPHMSWSDGAGGGDNWLTENTWCGVG